MRIKTKSKPMVFLTAAALSQKVCTVELPLWYLTKFSLLIGLVEGLAS